jgi:hypothetical protein
MVFSRTLLYKKIFSQKKKKNFTKNIKLHKTPARYPHVLLFPILKVNEKNPWMDRSLASPMPPLTFLDRRYVLKPLIEIKF